MIKGKEGGGDEVWKVVGFYKCYSIDFFSFYIGKYMVKIYIVYLFGY